VKKKLIQLVVGIASLIAIVVNQSAISAGAKEAASKLLLVIHIAELYGKVPDQNLEMPVQGVTKTQVPDTWHAPREGDRLHEGQDIFAKRGTPVISATDGYVIRIGENHLGGHTVSVVGGGGRIYYYAHLDAYAANLSVGDYVTPQTVLGYVGNTGNATGGLTHLHFGVYASGGALNPLPLLVDRFEEKNQPLKHARDMKNR